MNRFSAAAIAERLLKKGAIQSLTEIREKIIVKTEIKLFFS